MKRSLKYLSILVALLVIVTGCGTKDPKTQLSDAINKVNDAKSFSVKMDGNLSMSSQGMEIKASVNVSGDVNLENDEPTAHYTGSLSIPMLGGDQPLEGYIKTKDGKVYTYTKEDSSWDVETADYKKEDYSMDKIKEALDKAKSVEKVDSDKKGYTKLVVTVSSSDINNAMNDVSDGELSDAQLTDDFKFNVYLKDGYLSIIEIDLTDALTKLMSSETSNSAEVSSSAKFTIELSNFNKVDKVTIPSEVENSAKSEA